MTTAADCSEGIVRIIPPSVPALVYSSVPENEAPLYSPTTSYAVGSKAIAAGKIYENNSAGALTGVYPPDNLTQWTDLGFNNRLAMFDLYKTTATENPNSIIVDLTTTSSSNALVLLGVQASSVYVKATHPTEGVVFEKTYSMQETLDESGLYAWLWRERTAKTSLLELALPPYRGLIVRVEINAPGGVAKCGSLLLGRQDQLGNLKWGYKWALRSFSQKTVDEDGNLTIKKRPSTSRPEFAMRIARNDFDRVARIAERYESTPAVWVIGTFHEAMTVNGFYLDFAIVAEHGAWLDCSLQIEALK